MRYPNQKTVQIHKYLSTSYMTMSQEDNHVAMCSLSGSAYKLYVYLCENKDGYIKYLSYADFHEATGLSKPTYVTAKKELIKHGYLVEREDGDYDFYSKISYM